MQALFDYLLLDTTLTLGSGDYAIQLIAKSLALVRSTNRFCLGDLVIALSPLVLFSGETYSYLPDVDRTLTALCCSLGLVLVLGFCPELVSYAWIFFGFNYFLRWSINSSRGEGTPIE